MCAIIIELIKNVLRECTSVKYVLINIPGEHISRQVKTIDLQNLCSNYTKQIIKFKWYGELKKGTCILI